MKSKPASQVTSMGTGPAMKQAPISAPAAPAEIGIAGFGRANTVSVAAGPSGPGTSVPSATSTPPTFNSPSDSPKAKAMPGGPGRAGPPGTQGGTSSPTSKPGPSGLGLSGSKFPPIG